MGWQFVARPLPFVRRRRKSCCKSENLATLLTHWLTQWKGYALASKKAKWLTMTECHWTTQLAVPQNAMSNIANQFTFPFESQGASAALETWMADWKWRLPLRADNVHRTIPPWKVGTSVQQKNWIRWSIFSLRWCYECTETWNEAGKLSKNGFAAALISLVLINSYIFLLKPCC